MPEDGGRWLPPQEIAAHAAAGALAGLAADAVVHPIDTLKARLHAARRSPHSVYRSLPAAVLHLARRRSALKSLYAGVGPVLVGSAPTHGIIFAVYKSLQARWAISADGAASGVDPAVVDFLAGAIAETVALVAYVPSEVVAKRMQASVVLSSVPSGTASTASSAKAGVSKSKPVEMLRNIYKTGGIRGLYTGAVPTMLRDVPFTGLQLGLFEGMKMLYMRPAHGDAPETMAPWEAASLGFVAGGIAAAGTNPIDVLKTRIQIGDVDAPKLEGQQSTISRPSLMWCARKMVAEDGWRGLFRGIGARIAWVAPASAITLSVYEATSSALLDRVRSTERAGARSMENGF